MESISNSHSISRFGEVEATRTHAIALRVSTINHRVFRGDELLIDVAGDGRSLDFYGLSSWVMGCVKFGTLGSRHGHCCSFNFCWN